MAKKRHSSNGKPRARKKPDIAELFTDRKKLNSIISRGIRDAILQHKRAGNPIATWRDGQVVWIPPEKIKA